MSNFKSKVKQSLEDKIPAENDYYDEIKYSNNFFVHIQSYIDTPGSIEIQVIVPHEYMDDKEASIGEIEGAIDMLKELETILEQETSESVKLEPYLVEVVDDGAWKTPASMYSTGEISLSS